MYIKRDYSQPFFGSRRRKRGTHALRTVILFILFLGAFLTFVNAQFDRLQLIALDAVGMAPTPTPFASTLATQGYQLFLNGDVLGAEEYFRQAVAQQPDEPSYLYEYGRIMIERILGGGAGQDYSPAIAVATHLLEVAPLDVRGYALMTRALVFNNDAASAIPIGINGLEIDTTYAPLHTAMGLAYLDIARYQQALYYSEQATTLDPNDPFAHRNYANVLTQLGRYEEAIDQMEQAVALAPNLVNSRFELAALYLTQDNNEAAVATYESILALQPRNVRAMVRMCAAYLKVGLFDQARGYCDDATEIDPNNAQAWQQLGELSFRRRNYEGAIEAYTECRRLNTTGEGFYIQCWYIRGLAYYYLDRCTEAWTDLTDALELLESNGETTGPVVEATRDGLRLTAAACPAYAGQVIPTSAPPTIVPTPIGG
jgi:tetratricopeptide (TPR) repeat protein